MRYLRKGKDRLKGFTLIELMIVVAIISILVAVAIPNFLKYRKKAAKSACLSDLKIALNQCAAYLADNTTATITDCSANDTKYVKNITFNETNGVIYVKGTCQGVYSATCTIYGNGTITCQ